MNKRQPSTDNPEPEKQEDYIFVKSNKRTFKLNLHDILYIEALGDYIKIFTLEKMIISYQSLKNLEGMMPQKSFPRVHKSFIISLNKIDSIEGNVIRIKERQIPIGTNYKVEFEKLVKSI